MGIPEGTTKEEALGYEIIVAGYLNDSWSTWLYGIRIEHVEDDGDVLVTKLSGSMPDQSALRGVLNKIWDLNLTLVSVQCTSLQIDIKERN